MALLTHEYYCPKQGMASEFRIVIPDACLQEGSAAASVLFLLPPQGENGLSCLMDSGIASYLEGLNIALVVPPCLQGCFTDMAYGYPFYQSLKYVREYLKSYLPGLPLERGKCAVAGMGISALAALRWAIEEPDFFLCVGSISGLLDPAMRPQGYFSDHRLSDLFGDPEERIKKSEEFLESCRNSAVKNVHLFSSADDPGYDASLRAAEALGERAALHLDVIRTDRLKSFLHCYINEVFFGR